MHGNSFERKLAILKGDKQNLEVSDCHDGFLFYNIYLLPIG